jgi:hypothetical protein
MTGDIPPPIGCHTASLVGRYIFIYGGDDVDQRMYSDIYRLDTGTSRVLLAFCCSSSALTPGLPCHRLETLVIEKLTINGELQPERSESHDAVVVGNHILYYGGQVSVVDRSCDLCWPH